MTWAGCGEDTAYCDHIIHIIGKLVHRTSDTSFVIV